MFHDDGEDGGRADGTPPKIAFLLVALQNVLPKRPEQQQHPKGLQRREWAECSTNGYQRRSPLLFLLKSQIRYPIWESDWSSWETAKRNATLLAYRIIDETF